MKKAEYEADFSYTQMAQQFIHNFASLELTVLGIVYPCQGHGPPSFVALLGKLS